MLCSVGVDRQLLFWDLRAPSAPVIRLREVHRSDINTVDWCALNDNYVSTGSNDTLVKLIDTRKATSHSDANAAQGGKMDQSQGPIVATLHKHKSKVHTVKFSNFSSQYLASSGDSLVFWDLRDIQQESESALQETLSAEAISTPLEQRPLEKPLILDCDHYESHLPGDKECNCEEKTLLSHIGHIGTVSDFDWNHIAPWTIISASDDSEPFNMLQRNNDCSMQIFRPLDLLVMSEDEALQKID